MGTMIKEHAYDCYEEYGKNPGCGLFSYSKKTQRCYLKAANAGGGVVTSSDETVSGPKYCLYDIVENVQIAERRADKAKEKAKAVIAEAEAAALNANNAAQEAHIVAQEVDAAEKAVASAKAEAEKALADTAQWSRSMAGDSEVTTFIDDVGVCRSDWGCCSWSGYLY